MNNNLTSNVTFLSLAMGSFVGVMPALQAHDYIVAGGLALLGVILVFIYEKTPATGAPVSTV
jgi:VIT1/CCC1 family predicted Fe2+/Mn2+ transporter